MYVLFQTMHGSPKNIQVYPTQCYPTQAFQNNSGQSVNASPVPSTKASTNYTTHTSQTVVSIKKKIVSSRSRIFISPY